MQFNKEVQEVIKLSREVAIDLGESYISSYHFLIAILKFENPSRIIFNNKGLDFQDLIDTLQKKKLDILPQNFYLTKELERSLKISGYYAWVYYENEISVQHLILDMLADKRSYAGKYLIAQGISYSNFESVMKPVRKRQLFRIIGQNFLLIKIGFVGLTHKFINR